MYDHLKCPYCGSDFTSEVDYDSESHSEKRICIDCSEDYIAWFDETEENVIEITDRHGFPVEL